MCQALLCPLLDKQQQLGCTYRWGFPLSLTFQRGSSSLMLHHPEDLPALFAFLETTDITVLNWLQPLLRLIRRANTISGPIGLLPDQQEIAADP